MNPSTLRPTARLAIGAALVLAASAAVADPRGWHDRDDEDDDRGDVARVLEAVPRYVDVRVDVPERRCWTQRVDDRGDRRAAGTLLGGLLGGVIGHNLGGGDDRGFGTVAGAVVGGVIGHEVAASSEDDDRRYGRYGRDDRYERERRDAGRTVERCQDVMRPTYQRRIDGYDVVYEYAGRRYQTHLAYDPGPTLEVAPRWR